MLWLPLLLLVLVLVSLLLFCNMSVEGDFYESPLEAAALFGVCSGIKRRSRSSSRREQPGLRMHCYLFCGPWQ